MATATLSRSEVRKCEPADTLSGQDILCFSQDWNGDPLSKTHLMRLLAKKNRILWVNSIGLRRPRANKADAGRAFKKLAAAFEPIREVERNIFVLNPLAVPAHGNRLVRELNRRWLRFQVCRAMRQLGFRRPINWVFNPAAGILAGELGERLVIYQCVDEYTAFAGVPAESIAALENQLLQRADLIIVSAELLYQSKSKVNARTFLVRHGVDYDHFSQALDPELEVPGEIARLPRPILGFFGLVDPHWIDLDLLAQTAKHFTTGSVVIVGKVVSDVSVLKQLSNVHFLGRKPYADLPAYCKAFDVALLPFQITELTLNSNPLKVREYLAAGLPVVSTAIPEVAATGQCLIARDRDQFIHQIEAALLTPGPRSERSEAVRSESWQARLDEIRNHINSLYCAFPAGVRS